MSSRFNKLVHGQAVLTTGAWCLAFLALLFNSPARAADDYLQPEAAFKFSAKMLDPVIYALHVADGSDSVVDHCRRRCAGEPSPGFALAASYSLGMAIVSTALGVAAGLLGPALFSLTGMGARLKAGGSSVFKTQKSS
jgi:hypothetical protein